MKFTYQALQQHYLDDLSLIDKYHGDRPKVRYMQPWKNLAATQPSTIRTFDPFKEDVWVWSDIHFGHKNIIKYADGRRPYHDHFEMNDAMIQNYLKVVKPGDVVIWGGDIGFMSERSINDILRRLPGYNVWIVGNHDIHRDGTVYRLEFNERHMCMPVDIVEPDGFEYQLLFTHYPLDIVPPKCQNVHGHIHQHTASPWNTNICVEHTGCAPINLRTLLPSIRSRIEQHG